jgi:lincosamide nucleotidyltransferase
MYQLELIDRVRDQCTRDPGLDAALMYGSFVKDEADAHSDIEFWLFHTPAARAALDPAAWCARIAPTLAVLRNEFGAHVAVFPGLIRGEFHFATTDDLPQVATWPEGAAHAERMLILDRSARLAPLLAALPRHAATPNAPDALARACEPLANWLVLARNLVERGELLRAWDALGHAVRHLTWMARLAEDATGHWLTPSRAAEHELTPATAAALTAATAPAHPEQLRRALHAATAEGRRHWHTLAARYPTITVPDTLLDELTAALADPIP